MASISPQLIQGVRISCGGDIGVLKAKQFIPVLLVDRSAPMFKEDLKFLGDFITEGKPVSSHPISPLSELVGTPVEVRKITPDIAWKDDDVCGRYNNQKAALLLIGVDPKSSNLGLAPMTWQNKKIEALCAYNSEVSDALREPSEYDYGCEGDNDDHKLGERARVVNGITPFAFQEYFEKFKKEKLVEDPTWADEIAPVLLECRESPWRP